MARGKKTIQVLPLVTWANAQLERKDDDATKDFKSGVCVMIEKVLLSSNNYHGFCFLDNEDCDIRTLGYFTRKYM